MACANTFDESASGSTASVYEDPIYMPSAKSELNVYESSLGVNSEAFVELPEELKRRKFVDSWSSDVSFFNRFLIQRKRFARERLQLFMNYRLRNRQLLTELVAESLLYRRSNQSFKFRIFDVRRAVLNIELSILFIEESISFFEDCRLKPLRRRRFVDMGVVRERASSIQKLTVGCEASEFGGKMDRK